MFGTSVKVIAGSNGEVVQQNANKPEYGSIAFAQNGFTLRNGFLNSRRKVAFISGNIEELRGFATGLKFTDGAEVPGKLYTREQFMPYYEGQQAKLNPQTGRAVLVDGAMVFAKTFYDETGTQADVYLNGEITEGDVIAEPRGSAIVRTIESSSLS